jgi:LysM repeat protein
MDLPEDCHITAQALCTEDVQGSIGDKGIEVRFPVEFQVRASTRKKRVCLTSVKIASETPKDLSGAPSLVLRSMGKDETLWSLAKDHNTTSTAILAANGLEDEASIPQNKLLLIPRKRA